MRWRAAAGFALLVAAFALAAWLGWWTLPLVAALWGASRPAVRRPILTAALAALLGWAAWLCVDALRDPGAFGRLMSRLGAVLQLPGALVLLATLIFPALLAWCAAALACGLAGFLAPHAGKAR